MGGFLHDPDPAVKLRDWRGHVVKSGERPIRGERRGVAAMIAYLEAVGDPDRQARVSRRTRIKGERV